MLDWALTANMYQLKKLTARCELFIMKNFHANPASRRILVTLSKDSQLRIYKCAPLWYPLRYPSNVSRWKACSAFLFALPSFVCMCTGADNSPALVMHQKGCRIWT